MIRLLYSICDTNFSTDAIQSLFFFFCFTYRSIQKEKGKIVSESDLYYWILQHLGIVKESLKQLKTT